MLSNRVDLPINENNLTAKVLYEFSKKYHNIDPLKFTLTISRQYGCRSFPLAEAIQAMLNDRLATSFRLYDDDLNKYVSDVTGVSEESLVNLGDSSQLLDLFSGFMPNHLTHSEVYQIVRKEIRRLAKDGNVIIVGKGGGVICRDLKNCINVRIEAPLEMRVKYLMNSLKKSEKDAKSIIDLSESNQLKFYTNKLKVDITNPINYDLVVREGIPTDQLASIICDYFIRKRKYVLDSFQTDLPLWL
jgi:cytidylate kinase